MELMIQSQKKILKKIESKELAPPEDPNIKTLYIGNISEDISSDDLRSKFYYFGEIKSISIKIMQNCAFIEFTSREAAEAAAETLNNNLEIRGMPLKVSWAKSHKEEVNMNNPPPLPGSYESRNEGLYYPSMDPKRLGSYVQLGPKKPTYHQDDDHIQTSITNTSIPIVNTAPEVDDDEEENNED